uniref:Metallo-beta-lactamase domain-containing protein n=1 Tax=Oryza meridionalis TaxID=40149 RepID=A0A0E0EXE5_9ORYZ
MHTTTKKPIEIGTIGAGITKTVCISLASLVFSRTHGGGGNGGGHALPSAGSGWRGGGGQQAATVPEAAGDGLRQRPPLRRIRREGRREAAAPSPRPDSAGRHRHLPPPSATTARHPPALPPAATARRHRPPLPSCWSAVAWVCVVAPLSPPPQPPLPPAPARPPASADAFDCGIHPAYSGMAVLPYFDEIDPSTIDVLLITHFHLDHAASLPYFLEKITVHQLRTTTQTDGRTQLPPHSTDAPPSANSIESLSPRVGPGPLRSTTRRPPRQFWPKVNPGLGSIASTA